jgi:hypothetical protein
MEKKFLTSSIEPRIDGLDRERGRLAILFEHFSWNKKIAEAILKAHGEIA